MHSTKITPEDAALLLAVARPDENPQRIGFLAGQIRDFGRLFELSRGHGVLPLLYSRLVESGACVPAKYMAQLYDEYCTNVAQNLAAVAELGNVLELFGKSEIPALPFKGVALANLAYGKLGLRPAGDLDVLIYRRDLDRATQAALSCGYELRTPIQANGEPSEFGKYEYHFQRASDGMTLELRWRLTQWHFHSDLAMDWLWPRRQRSTLLGTNVPSFSPEDTLLLLCLHGSKHRWSRLIWVCDVAQLLQSHPNSNWNQAIRNARRLGLSRTLALGVLVSQRVAKAPVPERISQRFQASSVAKLAECIAESFFDDWKQINHSQVPYHLQLLGFRDRARMWWRSRPFAPNEKDRSSVQIPRALHFLYYLVRPVRVLLDSWK